MTSSRMAVLSDLTRGIGEAMVQGDLARALMLLEQRHKVIQGIDWSPEAIQEFGEDLASLRNADLELISFCQNWRAALKKRLEALNAGHLLKQSYGREASEARFVDVRK